MGDTPSGEYSQGGGKRQVGLRSERRGVLEGLMAVVSREPRQVAVPEDTGGFSRSRAGSEEGEETGSFQSPSLW